MTTNAKQFSRGLFLACALALPLFAVACGDDDKGPDPIVPGDFVFETSAPTAYVRIDRMGMPAIATVVIDSKALYNQDDPIDDVTGTPWAAEITAKVTGLHTALDDDLAGLGLTPCAVGDCIAQAAPLVIPDVLTINTNANAGFPNGRMLPDQVIDITLAVILLDLDAHSVTTLASVPVNPASNDRTFLQTFPYLAAPNS